jgi:hypothetical protein
VCYSFFRVLGTVFYNINKKNNLIHEEISTFLFGVRSVTDTTVLSVGSKTILRKAELADVFLFGLTSNSYGHVTYWYFSIHGNNF